MNNKVVLKIVVICAAVFVVFGVLAAALALNVDGSTWRGEKFMSVGKGEPFEYHKNETFALEGTKQINIDTVSTDVQFYQSEGELEITLDCYGYTNDETITLEADQIGSVINIEVKYPKTFFGGVNITESLLQIGIPEGYAESIDINGVSSDVTMNIDLNNNFSEVEIDLVSGDVKIECSSIDVLDCHSTSGNIVVKHTLLNRVIADTTSGDIDISNLSSQEGKVDIHTVSGRVALAYDKLCQTKIDTVSGDVRLKLPTDSIIDLEYDSVSGDLNGNYNKNSDGVYVHVDTTSGDLTIN